MKNRIIFIFLAFATLAFRVAAAGPTRIETPGQATDLVAATPALPTNPSFVPPTTAGSSGSLNAVVLPFSKLGAFRPVRLKGISDSKSIAVAIRLDRIVTAARLRLTYTYSPALLFGMSHIRVLVNRQVVATVPFKAANAGSPVTQEIPLNPLFFTNFNQVTLELVAHYTVDQCEDPANSALWADISPSSELILEERTATLPNDLSLLPAPFFDRGDSGRLVLPFVFGTSPGDELLRSAGIVASWFGMLADYRGARFLAVNSIPGDSDAVIVATAADLPPALKEVKIDGPTLAVMTNPIAPDKKILLVLGRNNTEVQTAAQALVLGKAILSGTRSVISSVDPGPPRQPYDAAKWLSLAGPVQFKDIVTSPDVLEVRGGSPDPIRIDVRVPADLFEWTGRGVPLDLKYRYTAPSVVNDSTLTIDINDSLVKSYRLTPRRPEENKSEFGYLRVPLLNDGAFSVNNSFNIPAFRVGSDNQLQLEFTLDSQKSGMCTGIAYNPARAAVDPDSTIDFSGFAHYAILPNLAFFANSGFPYTTLADLADTAMVIPDHPSPADIQTMLTVLGYMGKWTGVPSLRVQVLRSHEVQTPLDKDLIVIGSGPSAALFNGWDSVAPVHISAAATGSSSRYSVSLTGRNPEGSKSSQQHIQLNEDGEFGVLVGMQSPFHKSRSVVAITGTDPRGLSSVLDALEDPGKVRLIQDEMVLVRGDKIEAVRTGGQYAVGNLPWYARIWVVAIKHPILLALFGIIAGILVAIGIFLSLQSISSRRRGV